MVVTMVVIVIVIVIMVVVMIMVMIMVVVVSVVVFMAVSVLHGLLIELVDPPSRVADLVEVKALSQHDLLERDFSTQ